MRNQNVNNFSRFFLTIFYFRLSWTDYTSIFLTRKSNLVSMEDVEMIFQPKKRQRVISESSEAKTLDELLKKSKKVDEAMTSSDSGQASNTTSPPEDKEVDLEELSDMELFTSDEDDEVFLESKEVVIKKEEIKILDECEIISSEEEW